MAEALARPAGLKVIIAYKAVKAPAMLAIAAWLTLSPHGAYEWIGRLGFELSEGGHLASWLGRWIDQLLTASLVTRAAVLAWLDGITTIVEAVLLWRGKTWGEWLVTLGLAALLPFEIMSLARRPSWLKAGVIVINGLAVAYLARRRLRALRHAT